MGRTFDTARFPSGEAPSILGCPYTAGQTFLKGAILHLTGAGTVSEAANAATTIYGVALQGAATGYGYAAANAPTVITGQEAVVSVALFDRVTIFSCRGVNGGTDPVIPTIANIGLQYGIVKVANDWCLDISNTTQKVLQVMAIDTDNNVFFVKGIDTATETP